MVTRTINNATAPLVDGQGNPLADVRLTFQLVDRCGRTARNVFDAAGDETLSPGLALVLTDEAGLFSLALWPTSRGANSYYYRVRGVAATGREVVDFIAPLPDGIGALAWPDFMALAGLWQDPLPTTPGTLAEDAPSDGKLYLRKDKAWEELSIS